MRIASVLSSLACIGAGIYLLGTQAVAENSLLETLMHGIGIYFIGKGIYVGSSLAIQTETARHTRALVELEQAKRRQVSASTPASADEG
jgi:hypothetical protein